MALLDDLGGTTLVAHHRTDVATQRERRRQVRLRRATYVLGPLAVWAMGRWALGNPVSPGLPSMPAGLGPYAPALALIGLLGASILGPILASGRSPHVLVRPEDAEVRLDDVVGADSVVNEVVGTLNLFLSHRTFTERMGGRARRGVLFEGPPGTGKTHVAKAMAAEAGVPFLFVSSSAFQSMYYGQTNRKIRAYFAALRKHARREGGAIGFIEEIDAIGAARSGMGSNTQREGVAGVVNELLVQLQSFDTPSPADRLRAALVERANRWLPTSHRLAGPRSTSANILVIGATNRAADLDPALVRPGRFDRTITFDLPSRSQRRALLQHGLATRAHHPDLTTPDVLDRLAAQTAGASPADLVQLLDEALLGALRRGAQLATVADVEAARLLVDLGLTQPVDLVEADRRRIATHEAGHAVVAHVVSPERSLDLLSIVKRGRALGLLAHSDPAERFTATQGELEASLRIAFGGMAAEAVLLGDTSSGVGADLAQATSTAAHMVGALGMAGSLASFDVAQVGGADLVAKVLSDEPSRQRLEALLDAARAEADAIVRGHRHLVEALRDGLLAHDELGAAAIAATLERAATPAP